MRKDFIKVCSSFYLDLFFEDLECTLCEIFDFGLDDYYQTTLLMHCVYSFILSIAIPCLADVPLNRPVRRNVIDFVEALSSNGEAASLPFVFDVSTLGNSTSVEEAELFKRQGTGCRDPGYRAFRSPTMLKIMAKSF